MTKFSFMVNDVYEANKALKKIDDKFNANQKVKSVLWREIKHKGNGLYECEFIFPFPDLRGMSWIALILNLIIFYFYRHIWIFGFNLLMFFTAYRVKYMTSSKYYFKMLVKGMRKNGYKGNIKRAL